MAPKLRIGDRVIIPWRARRHATELIAGWSPGTVIARRGDRLIVRSYGHDREHPAWEVLPYPRSRAGWPRTCESARAAMTS